MAKNTKQIALIQHRRGKLSELPKQLNDAEFGFATDTNELFIGNSSHEVLAERVNNNKAPYGNVQVLTEFTDNLTKITYRYKSNTDIQARIPIEIVAGNDYKSPAKNSKIQINGQEITFPNDYNMTLSMFVNEVNNKNFNVKAFVRGNKLGFVSTASEIVISEITPNSNCVKSLGFGDKTSVTEIASLPIERTLQEVLDDRFSVKHFGAKGNGEANDSLPIYNAIVALNKAGNQSKYYRTIFMPSGDYIVSQSLPMPHGLYLQGEGIGRTVIKAQLLTDSLFMTMDSNMNMANGLVYGTNDAELPKNITLENMTLDVSESFSHVINLNGGSYITFRNVEFIGNKTDLVRISSNSSNIVFDGCIFRDGLKAIYAKGKVDHLTIHNNEFNGLPQEAIYLEGAVNNSTIINNLFTNCSANSKRVIFLNNETSYVSVINNKLDKEVIESSESDTETKIYPFVNESTMNFIDILDNRTDERKVLQFSYPQPQWKYIDSLIDPNGQEVLQTKYDSLEQDGQTVIKETTNSLVINPGNKDNENTVSISTLNEGHIHLAPTGDVHLGQIETTDETEEGGETTEGVEAQSEENVETNTGSKNHIILHQDLDVNNQNIVNQTGNIVFKTNDNHLIIDGDNYAQSLGMTLDAIPNVEYVNHIAQTSIKKKIDNDVISESSSNGIELVTFNQETYGDNVFLTDVSINVGKPFYTMLDKANEDNALVWKSGLTYYAGNIVQHLGEDKDNSEFKLYERSNITLDDDDENSILKKIWNVVDENSIKNYSSIEERDKATVDNGIYATINNNINEMYYRADNEWYLIGSYEWSNLYPTYAIGKADEKHSKCPTGSKFKIGIDIDTNKENYEKDYVEIELVESTQDNGVSVDEAVTKINETMASTVVSASNENGALKITCQKGELSLEDITNAPLEAFGFELDSNDEFIVHRPQVVTSFDTTESVESITSKMDMDNDLLVQTQGKIRYYVCSEDHEASERFDDDLKNSEGLSKWIEIFNEGLDVNSIATILDTNSTASTLPLSDAKYVSIVAEREDEPKRLLLKRSLVDITKRDINSTYYPTWESGKEYEKDDKCLFNNRYYVCQHKHTSENDSELNTPNYWKIIKEEGYNYHFSFDRTIYELDNLYNVVEGQEIVGEFNLSNYKLSLEFVDKDGNRLKEFTTPELIEQAEAAKENPSDAITIPTMIQVNPTGLLTVTLKYIRGI